SRGVANDRDRVAPLVQQAAVFGDDANAPGQVGFPQNEHHAHQSFPSEPRTDDGIPLPAPRVRTASISSIDAVRWRMLGSDAAASATLRRADAVAGSRR